MLFETSSKRFCEDKTQKEILTAGIICKEQCSNS